MKIKNIYKVFSVAILLIIFIQILYPTLNSYAMQEQLENINQENVVNEIQIEETENQNTTEIISEEIEKESSFENNIIEEESEIILNDENVFEEEVQNIKETDEVTDDNTNENTVIEVNSVLDSNDSNLQDIFNDELTEKSEKDLDKVKKFEEINSSKLIMNSLMSTTSSIMVANETEFRNAINNGYSTLITKNKIAFSNPITIDRSITIKPTSSENSINYSGYGSFITVTSGGSLDLSSMVVYTNGIGANHNLIAINIESGGTVIFNENSIVDGGSGNTGIVVNSGGTLHINSCYIVNSTKGVVAKENSTITFGNLNNGRTSEFWNNTTAILFEEYTGTSNFNQSNIKIRNNTNGIVFESGTGTVNISGGEYYSNSENGVVCTSGNINISGGTIYSNGNGVLQRNGVLNISGGSNYNNNYGINLESGYSGKMTITNINMYSNSQYAIIHNQTNDKNCTILGGNISGKIYLGKENNYINTNGSFISLEIMPSSYYFKRKLVKTNSNEIAKTEVQKVSVTPTEPWYKYVEQEYIVLWKNSNLLITCYDADNSDVKLQGFTFELYVDDVDLPYKKDDFIGTFTTDENGKILIEDLWTGKYYLKEIKSEASKFYQLIEQNIELDVSSDSTNNFFVKNEKQKGQIEINKIVSKSDSSITGLKKGSALKGATFEIINEFGEVVDKIVADENGYAISNRLPIDETYIIRESLAPKYYLKDESSKIIKFNSNNEIVSLNFENEAVKTDLSIGKKGIIQAQPNDEIRYNFKRLKNLSNVELNHFAFIDSLPVKQVTITKLFTGVYSHELKYDVYYKTNKSDWNIIAKDLDSTVNHYINLRNLPLNEDETVTDIKIDFGTVPAGFEATTPPFIFTKVNNDVERTDELVNRCMLIGEYEDLKLTNTAEWKTITYGANLKTSKYNNSVFNKFFKKVLPKTGR